MGRRLKLVEISENVICIFFAGMEIHLTACKLLKIESLSLGISCSADRSGKFSRKNGRGCGIIFWYTSILISLGLV